MEHLVTSTNALPLAFTYATDADSAGVIVGVIMLLILMVVGTFFYFLPALIAILRSHTNWGAIAIVNLFFGWTFIGWVVALAWSVTGQRENR